MTDFSAHNISAWQFTATPRMRLNSRQSQRKIFLQVFAVHALVIFVPLIIAIMEGYFQPKEEVFVVDLSGPLSTGPEVGPPERIAPGTPDPDTRTADNEQASPPEPDILPPENPPIEPERPETPSDSGDTVPEEPELTNLPKPKPQQPKIPAEPKLPRLPKARPKEPDLRGRLSKLKPPKNSGRKSSSSSASKIYNPKGKGGTNTNEFVPIGSRDLAQKLGPQNNGTPGGSGQTNAQYHATVGVFLKKLWEPPSNIFLDGKLPEVRILLVIDGGGRIIEKRIISTSGNSAMDDSVRMLLRRIERLPAPADGKRQSIDIILRPEE